MCTIHVSKVRMLLLVCRFLDARTFALLPTMCLRILIILNVHYMYQGSVSNTTQTESSLALTYSRVVSSKLLRGLIYPSLPYMCSLYIEEIIGNFI